MTEEKGRRSGVGRVLMYSARKVIGDEGRVEAGGSDRYARIESISSLCIGYC